jgi:hypothetical protein
LFCDFSFSHLLSLILFIPSTVKDLDGSGWEKDTGNMNLFTPIRDLILAVYAAGFIQ